MKLISSGGGSRATNKHASSRRSAPTRQSSASAHRRHDTQELPRVVRPAESQQRPVQSQSVPVNRLDPGVRIVRDAGARPEYVQPPVQRETPIPDVREAKREAKRARRKRALIRWCIALVSLVALYFFCVYTSIPFIANLRSLYIETAMTTMEHQWLATSFIPLPVIQETMKGLDRLEESQDDMVSDWGDDENLGSTVLPQATKPPVEDENTDDNQGEDKPDFVKPLAFWEDPEHEFWDTYYEIDYKTFHAYALKHKDEMFNEEGYLFIDEADAESDGTGIVTTNGDPVLAIDAQNGIILVRFNELEYYGVMAIVKDPHQITLSIAKGLGSYGSKIATLAENENAILAINASGFEDDEGHGTGGIVHGLLYKDGVKYEGSDGGTYKAIYFDSNYRLNVRAYEYGLDIYHGVEFKPALVINGEAVAKGSAGWGIAPRCAIGQREDGSVLMIVIDGRQTHSVGITVGDLADIFVEYNAYQAANLDGGTSAVMYYNGRIITRPSGADKVNGRSLPNAFVALPRSALEDTSGETGEE